MKAIKRIEIQSFQSHKSTVIEPASAGELTVLTGATDSGKSAVFRALRWIYYGGPVYARTGCTAVSVSVHLDDGTVVTRSRASSTNRYVVTRPGQEPQVYEGFGREIPLEVQQALGVRPLDIAGLTLEVNLARQHDPAFLVSAVSAPARAKALGQIAGVEAVDMAMRSAGRDIFDGQRELRQVEAEAAELEEQVRQYDYLPELARRIEHVEGLLARLEAAEGRKERMVSIRGRLETARSQQAQWEAVRRRTAGAVAALAAINRAQELAAQRSTLSRLSRALTDCAAQERKAKAVIARTAGASAALVAIDRAQGHAARRSTLSRIGRALADCATRETEAKAVIARTAGAAQAIALATEAERRIERRRRLGSIQDRLARINTDHARISRHVASLLLALAAVTPAIEEAEATLHRLSSLRRIAGTLQQTIGAQSIWARKRDEAQTAAEAARNAYARALQEAGRCPTCGGPINHQHLKEVV